MSSSLRQLVRDRAGCRCEYCHLPDFAAPASAFHVEHIVAKQHNGSNDVCSLALAAVQFVDPKIG